MREYIDSRDVANTVMMLATAFDGTIAIVEGVTDRRLYGKFFDKDMGDQTHNALDDAKLLKMVHEKMKTGDRNFDAFLEYVDPYRYPDQVRKVLRMNGNTILEEYDNLNKAVEWLRTQPNDKGHKYLLNAGDKIKHAAKTSTRYFGYNWRIL